MLLEKKRILEILFLDNNIKNLYNDSNKIYKHDSGYDLIVPENVIISSYKKNKYTEIDFKIQCQFYQKNNIIIKQYIYIYIYNIINFISLPYVLYSLFKDEYINNIILTTPIILGIYFLEKNNIKIINKINLYYFEINIYNINIYYIFIIIIFLINNIINIKQISNLILYIFINYIIYWFYNKKKKNIKMLPFNIRVRSSTSKYSIVFVSGGLIDSGYTGNIKARFIALSDEDIEIKKGVKIMQIASADLKNFEIQKVEKFSYENFEFGCQTRGQRGFGSTDNY